MPDLYLKKIPGGMLIPDDDDTAEYIATKLKAGKVIKAAVTQPRNYEYLKKFMTLMQILFAYHEELVDKGVEYKGVTVKPSFDQFRGDLVILAGHYDATFDIRGNLKLRPKSVSFARCKQDEFERIYSDVIQAGLTHVCGKMTTEDELRESVDKVLGFA